MNDDLNVAINSLRKKFQKGTHNKHTIDRILFIANQAVKIKTSVKDCNWYVEIVKHDLEMKRNEFDKETIIHIEQIIDALEAYAIILELVGG
ncbi:MAG: hypothetical protein K0R18_1293 [Bacillales bacterium]|jgi:3-hydroxyacyl-CoA dehydrogenase|nr:hypothetical protein [Bacillales bacterium]